MPLMVYDLLQKFHIDLRYCQKLINLPVQRNQIFLSLMVIHLDYKEGIPVLEVCLKGTDC